jgi:hypothetical protein
MRLDRDTVFYFREMAEEMGIPYQNLINTALTLLILFFGSAHAKMYKWVDENGVTHYSNIAPPADHDKFHTREEARGRPVAPDRSPGLDHVLKSYEMEAMEEEPEAAGKAVDRKTKSNASAKDRYADKIEKYKREVEYWEEKLEDAKRESYTDRKKHKQNIRRCEKKLADYRARLRNAERNYRQSR